MGQPQVVADCVSARWPRSPFPSRSHRIGFDERDRYEDMLDFVDGIPGRLHPVHRARPKAWLQGLSQAEPQRPALRYPEVHRLKAERPTSTSRSTAESGPSTRPRGLDHVDAVMIGRAAWDDLLLFTEADHRIFGEAP